MPQTERFPYSQQDPALGPPSALPYLPIRLENQNRALVVDGLVDSGSALNVLPYDDGLQLGFDWNQQAIRVQLAGILAGSEARAVLVQGTVGAFPPVQLAFAWTTNNNVPAILGQVNFFAEFDVCFYRSQMAFEIKTTT